MLGVRYLGIESVGCEIDRKIECWAGPNVIYTVSENLPNWCGGGMVVAPYRRPSQATIKIYVQYICTKYGICDGHK